MYNLTFSITELSIIILISTISVYGFNNRVFFNKFCFNISAIKLNHEYYRFFTSGFLHADPMHLFFNMFTLFIFSDYIIYSFGNIYFFVILFGGVIIGNLLTFVLYYKQNSYTAIGASGGINSIMFATIALYPTQIKIGLILLPIMVDGYIFGMLYLCYSIYMEYNHKIKDNIGHIAHIGGAIFGVLIVFIKFKYLVIHNYPYLALMSLPLFYMIYDLINRKN